jgi:hypothetical protein
VDGTLTWMVKLGSMSTKLGKTCHWYLVGTTRFSCQHIYLLEQCKRNDLKIWGSKGGEE